MSETTLTLASWNILLGDDPLCTTPRRLTPQVERATDLGLTLKQECPPLDGLGLYEVFGNETSNCGYEIADQLGLGHYKWEAYGESSEGIVVATEQPNTPTRLDLPPEIAKRIAVIFTIGDVAVAATHLSWQITRLDWRTQQVPAILDYLQDFPRAVIMGDLNTLRLPNELPCQKPRRLIEQAGFLSVSATLPRRERKTFPTPDHRQDTLQWWQKALLPFGNSIDDIYVRGLRIKERGRFRGRSDHFGLWAMLAAA